MEQGVHQSAVWISRCRVNDHPMFFMEDNEVLVLVNDIERDLLRGCDVRNGLRNDDGNAVSGMDGVSGLCRILVEKNVLFANENLDSRP